MLTDGEFEVLRLASMGMTYRQIAEARRSTPQTVKNQMYDARRKLGARTTIEAFVLLGWLAVPRPRHNRTGNLR